MTHVLIGINNITVKIQQLELELRACGAWEDTGFIDGQISLLKELLEGKQISLDEEGINIQIEKAITDAEHMDYADITSWKKKGYKQALKDLL